MNGIPREEILESILKAMSLRLPQERSLEAVHNVIHPCGETVPQLSQADLVEAATNLNDEWAFPEGFVSLTFSLATGVGKTRLMGALIAYLYLADGCRNFVILAPRDAILRKLEAETRPGHPKYLFVESDLVPHPAVCHRGNLETFDPHLSQHGFVAGGPNVFVLSPQLLASGQRAARKSEYTGLSLLEYLSQRDDLVVLVDESHHLSTDVSRDRRAWGSAVAELRPKLAFAMTATPNQDERVAYEYGLRQCLREALYTKAVRLLVSESHGQYGDYDESEFDDYDSFVLRAAIARLEAKKNAAAECPVAAPGFDRPVLLVCARDTKHADSTSRWLLDEAGFAPSEVLTIHSKRKTEEDLERLADIEEPHSKVRVVVQVHVLDEGWDVSNVFVIAPLRRVESYRNARQVMGRGLRLPAGHRISDPELDTLDVLAFGQETYEDILRQVETEFGSPQDAAPGVDVVDGLDIPRDTGRPPAIDSEEEAPADWTPQFARVVNWPSGVWLPVFDVVPGELDIREERDEIVAACSSREARNSLVSAVDLGSLRRTKVEETGLPRGEIAQRVVATILRRDPALHATGDAGPLASIVDGVLDRWGDEIYVDPRAIANLIRAELRRRRARVPIDYVEPVESPFIPREAELSRPPDRSEIPSASDEWDPSRDRRVPVKGWKRCAHELTRFDSRPEWHVATRLDESDTVEAWLRNDPFQFGITTRVGRHYPDFVVVTDGRLVPPVVFVEIKSDLLWDADGAARTNAADLKNWCRRANDHAGSRLYESFLLLSQDHTRFLGVADLERLDAS